MTVMTLPAHIESIYRVIPKFMGAMTTVLLKASNLKKPHWSGDDNKVLVVKMCNAADTVNEELDNLLSFGEGSQKKKYLQKQCVDVANYAMMVHDNLKRVL